MIWETLRPNKRDDLEPPELQNLKYQLANLTCKCRVCTKKLSCETQISRNEMKTEQKAVLTDEFMQVNKNLKFPDNHVLQDQCQQLCPSCFVILNLLSGGLKIVFKDEESETKRDMFFCDKGTRKTVKYVEKTTSCTGKPGPKYSNVTFCDYISECSSDISKHDTNSCQQQTDKLNVTKCEFNQPNAPLFGKCFCVDNFIDSIRPPLTDFQ